MALITCPECGKEVSNTVKNCVHCGYSIKKYSYRKWLFIGLIIGIILVITLMVIYFTISDKEKINKCLGDNCAESVYTDGLCIEHYIEKKSGNIEIQDSNNEDGNANMPLEDYVEFEVGNKIKEETCEVKISKYNVTTKIEPPSPDSYYHYFEAERGNVFVDIIMDIKNLNNTAVSQDSVVGAVTMIYDETYEYRCQKVTEEDNGADLNDFTSLYSINPLETMRYHMIAEVPQEIKTNGKSIDVIIEVDGTKYKCKLR